MVTFDHLKNAGYPAYKALESRLSAETVRVAVTGLARAGKTVFITSLIHNLLAVARGSQNTLPKFLDLGIAERVVSAAVLPAAAEAIARFRYAENLADMAAKVPKWPSRTADISQISLELVMRRKPGRFGKVLGDRKVTVEILDYPGEWLMDLPLLNRGYAQWSEETLKAAAIGVRAHLSGKFLEFVRALNPNSVADEDTAKQAHTLYKEYLEACRDRHELRFLQPGRFLQRGPWDNLPLLWFCPLPSVPDKLKSGSVAKSMADRFEKYKAMQAEFFENHFQRFDRQIVLVDVLAALHAGKDSLEDTRRAIAEIAGEFRYGGSLLLRAFGRRIDRVYFAATKADHVPQSKRKQLAVLLEHMAGKASQEIGAKRTKLGFGALASVNCTQDGIRTIAEGRVVEVVLGHFLPKSNTESVADTVHAVFPGEIPVVMPSDQFWANKLFKMHDFKPPQLNPGGVTGIPHIDLDDALTFLLGDKL